LLEFSDGGLFLVESAEEGNAKVEQGDMVMNNKILLGLGVFV